MASINTITISDRTIWLDEWEWSQVARSSARAVAGNLVIQQNLKVGGRPVTLNLGWISRTTLTQLENLRDTPATPTFTVTLPDSSTLLCSFAATDNPIQVAPLVERPIYPETDYFQVTVSLITVA